MIFYDCATAPSPRRARIFLAEKAVPHEVVQIDLRAGEQLCEKFRTINPACTVPVLQLENGTTFTENLGIAAFLEAEFPDPPLMGRNSVEKGHILGWNAAIEIQGLMPVAEALRNSSPAMAERAITGPENFAQIPELAERGLTRLNLFFDNLNQHLKDRDFIASDEFSLADITAVVAVDFARIVKVTAQDHHQHLLRWRERLADRPSLAV